MTASPARDRPTSVTVMAVLTGLLGVWDFVIAGLLLIARDDPGSSAFSTEPAAYEVAAVVAALLGIAALALSVALWRGINAARLLVTLLLLFRLGYSLYLLSQLGDERIGQAVLSVGTTVAGVFLVWNRKAAAFFEQPSERQLATALAGDDAEISARRQYALWTRDFLVQLVILWITIELTPGITLEFWWSLPLAVAVITIAAELLRPWLVRLASLFGWLGSLVLALFANAILIGLGLAITPGVDVSSVRGAILASWVYALAMTVVTWAFSINTQNYLLVHAVRMSMSSRPEEDLPEPGGLFVQLDGVPGPVLEFQVKAGNLPTISRWIREGSHTWTEWVARIPSTTPVSQAGLLHGNNTDLPAFRWYE